MTKEEIIELKKYCIEQGAKVSRNGNDLAYIARYLFAWLIKEEDDKPLNEDVVPYDSDCDNNNISIGERNYAVTTNIAPH